MVDKLVPNTKFLENLCEDVPTKFKRIGYMYYEPNTFSLNVTPKCILSLDQAQEALRSSPNEYVFVFISYIFSSLLSPVSSALYELDISWVEFLESFALGVGVTIIFQILLYVIPKEMVYVSIVTIIGGLVYFICICFHYTLLVKGSADSFFVEYGQRDLNKELQVLVLYLVDALLILAVIMLIAMATQIMILVEALSKTIIVAMNVLKKAFGLVFIPLFFVVISLVQIFAYLFVILVSTSVGQFDARSSTFSSNGPTVLLIIFYALMMIHGTFLCVLLSDYLTGAITIQYYFVGKKKGACSGFTIKALWWMFAQFGSLVLESLCYTFMIWLRPVCEVIVERNKQLPQNKVFQRVVLFCRAYVSYCSLNTTFCLALTGKSLREAAQKYQSFLYEEDEAGTAVAEIQNSYLQMLSYDITVVTMLIKKIIREVSGADIDSDYIWIQVF